MKRFFEQHMLNLTFFSRAFWARFRLASFQLGLLLTTARQLSLGPALEVQRLQQQSFFRQAETKGSELSEYTLCLLYFRTRFAVVKSQPAHSASLKAVAFVVAWCNTFLNGSCVYSGWFWKVLARRPAFAQATPGNNSFAFCLIISFTRPPSPWAFSCLYSRCSYAAA